MNEDNVSLFARKWLTDALRETRKVHEDVYPNWGWLNMVDDDEDTPEWFQIYPRPNWSRHVFRHNAI